MSLKKCRVLEVERDRGRERFWENERLIEREIERENEREREREREEQRYIYIYVGVERER